MIADEPTTALDVTTQHQILLLLRELVGEFGISLLFVTHDFGVVAELCDDLCVIYAGQTVEAGAVLPILDAPAHPYTRALLACHPDRATSFTGIPGSVPSPLKPPPGCRFAPRCATSAPFAQQGSRRRPFRHRRRSALRAIRMNARHPRLREVSVRLGGSRAFCARRCRRCRR